MMGFDGDFLLSIFAISTTHRAVYPPLDRLGKGALAERFRSVRWRRIGEMGDTMLILSFINGAMDQRHK